MVNPVAANAALMTRRVSKGTLPEEVQRRRLERLSHVDCENLIKIIDIEEDEEGFTVTAEEIDGPALSIVRAGRAGLSLGEAWRLLADVCTALVELHSAGIIHGDLSPWNIIVRRRPTSGRAVVIDVGGEEEWELGTPGFQAPELVEGGHSDAASDVWSAARVALWAVGDEYRARFGEELREVLHVPAAQRPTAQDLAQKAVARATPSILLPDDARLASAHLRAQVAAARTIKASARPRRFRRRRLVALLTALTVAFGTYATVDVVAESFPAAAPHLGETTEPETPEAVVAVHELTRIRDEALASLDLAQLQSVTQKGSAAARADEDLLTSFRGSRPEGLRTQLKVRQVIGDREVEALISQSAFVWRDGARNGVHVGELPPRCVRFQLVQEDGGLVVQRVQGCAEADPAT